MKSRVIEKIVEIYKSFYVKTAHFCGVMLATNPLDVEFVGNPIYHLSGLASGIIASQLDRASTVRVIKLMNTPEFKERELKEFYYESNPIIGKHPTMRQFNLRNIPRELLIMGITTILPTTGYAYLSMSPIIYANNRMVLKHLESNLENYVTEDSN